MREKDKLTLLSALAFGWHVGDAFLHRKTKNKVHKVFMGVGVGWSGFWLLLNLIGQAKKEYTEAKYTPPVV